MLDQSSSLEGGESIKPQKRLLSFLFKEIVVPLPEESDRSYYPEKKSNFLSKVFFWWLIPLMNIGYRRTLHSEDLYILTDDMRVEYFTERFRAILEGEVESQKLKHVQKKCMQRGESIENSSVPKSEDLQDFVLTQFTLMYVLFQTFRNRLMLAGLLSVTSLAATSSNPLITKNLIHFVEVKALGENISVGKGIGYAIGCVSLLLIGGITINHYMYLAMSVGIEVRAILTNAILERSFRLSAKSKHRFPNGKITSMMSTDLSRIQMAVVYQPLLLTLPIPIAIAILILIINIGVSAIIGIAIFLIFLAAISLSTRKLYRYRSTVSKFTDSRVDLIKEVLNNLKMIKFYSWEVPYLSNIIKARSKEIGIILRIQTLRNFINAIAMSLTGISSMVAFLILYAIDKKTKDAASIFSSVSSFEILSFLVFFIPTALSSTADMLMGLKRIGEFLSCEEDEDNCGYHELLNAKNRNAIEIKNGNFYWDVFDDDAESNKDEKEDKTKNSSKQRASLCLNEINLTIRKGEFIVVTGSIGSGKSSLLNAIAGFMKCGSGSIDINGSLLLCGSPWVQNTTIQENILFGLPYNKQFYNDVIYACSLQNDLNNLPGGDFTEVGERGITLSGGQKARINLARSVYAHKNIILMDDVLSAVDARVGKHIVNNCILGLLKDKTRILATHQLSLIDSADRIIYLNGDGTIDIGTMNELLVRNKDFNKLMSYCSASAKKETENIEQSLEEDIEEIEELGDRSNLNQQLIRRKTKIKPTEAEDDEAIYKNIELNKDVSKGKIIEKEERAVNHIKKEIYRNYVKYGSGKLTSLGFLVIFLVLLSIATFCDIFTNTWLSFWISHKFDRSNSFYIGLYVMFNILWVIFLSAQFICLVNMTTSASKNLNLMAMKKLLYSPMSFLDTTPMGRILNRFTKDTDSLDNEISEQLRLLTYSAARMVGIIILNIIYLPWVALAVPFLGAIFVSIANYYQASSREIKRLEAVQRSFVFNNFNEVLSGMHTIKSYKSEERFIELNNKLINKMNEASYLVFANQRWLAINLEVIACVFAFIISLLCVVSVFHISSASVGLLVSYSLQITGELSLLVKTFTQVENDMNSVERLCHYALKLPQEAEYIVRETQPKTEWPSHGAIKFDNVSMSYRPGLPLVLKGLSFKVNGAEKIGICGRTGAGKSSIMTALYRLSELDKGRILVDNIDISKLGLKDLRSKLSIIPQDPVLFNGTIRKNLDPFGENNDEKLWDALKRTGVISQEELPIIKLHNKETDDSLHKFHLDKIVEDEGSNFSLGERQLISFARALVRDSRILILDEATSSVDYETDSKIQTTIANEFSHCTILCIAHRLRTIINYDKIMTLDRGNVKEFDTPKNLFNLENGIFRQMCEKSNIVAEDFN